MSSCKQACTSGSYSPCDTSCPQPITKSWSQPCVTSCGDSRAVVYPPPVVITFPGPILSSCPQESIVGSSAPLGVGSSAPLGIGSSLGYGGSLEGQSSLGSGASQGAKYSYSCYSRSCKIYRPLKPCVVTGQTKKEYEQIHKA